MSTGESRLKNTLHILQRLAWILFLVCLPVTSFPFFPPALGGGALVRPLSLYPLLALLVLFTIPHLLTRPLPRTVLNLAPFLIVALAASLLSILRGIDPALGISVTERVLRALLTLGIGVAIYLTVALFPRTQEDLDASLRWIYLGFSIALLWGSLQAVYIVHFTPDYFHAMNRLQDIISIRRLFNNRVSGMTYEPNWFGEQISFLLLPWLLASVLTKHSVFRWRWRKVTIEMLLLVWASGVLVFTFSRAGLLNLLVLAFCSFLIFASSRSSKHTEEKTGRSVWTRRLIEAVLVVAVLSGVIYGVGKKNTFFSRLWSYWIVKKNRSISGYLEYIGFGARFSYGETAYGIYSDYPVFGVGLGNYAFYFDEYLPDEPLAATPEILRIVTPEEGRNRLITPKNFYFRLLAETGLIGLAAFMAFVVAIVGCALFLWLSKDPRQRFWGIAGLLGSLVFLLAALSFDSFTIPNMWVVFGMTTSAAWVFIRQSQSQAAPSNSVPAGKPAEPSSSAMLEQGAS